MRMERTRGVSTNHLGRVALIAAALWLALGAVAFAADKNGGNDQAQTQTTVSADQSATTKNLQTQTVQSQDKGNPPDSQSDSFDTRPPMHLGMLNSRD